MNYLEVIDLFQTSLPRSRPARSVKDREGPNPPRCPWSAPWGSFVSVRARTAQAPPMMPLCSGLGDLVDHQPSPLAPTPKSSWCGWKTLRTMKTSPQVFHCTHIVIHETDFHYVYNISFLRYICRKLSICSLQVIQKLDFNYVYDIHVYNY